MSLDSLETTRTLFKLGKVSRQQLIDEIRASAVEAVADVVHAANEPKPTYPKDHVAGMRVPKGGSSCASCKFLADNKTDCTSTYFQKWNGGPEIPGKIDEYCSDWYVSSKDLEAGGPGSGRHPEQPTPNTKEATEWHNEALNKAREKLGPNASLSEVLQEAARIQQKGKIEVWIRKAVISKDKDIDSASENSQRGQFDGSLWNGIRLFGFTGPEEENLKAMLSRIPPELFFNVKEIKSAKELDIKHGRYIPETKTVQYNPRNFSFRQRFGKGEAWIWHAELTAVHEIGHSIYEAFTPEQKDEWEKCSGWVKGWKEGNSPAYVEVRPGWPHETSQWTHKAGVKFTRHYAEKNPNEQFSDCFAFYMMNKGHQMEKTCRKFLDKFIKANVKKYPQASVRSPEKPYGTV